MEISYYNSPIGVLEIISEDGAVVSLKPVKTAKSENTALPDTIKTQLDEYFAGKRIRFDIKLKLKGTEFQKKVWAELLNIPYGETRYYSEIAENIGNKNACKAVGSACNKNPVIIIVPCHRVISKTGGFGGFAHGNLVKQKLLQLEA